MRTDNFNKNRIRKVMPNSVANSNYAVRSAENLLLKLVVTAITVSAGTYMVKNVRDLYQNALTKITLAEEQASQR